MKPQIRIGCTLADGTVHSFDVDKMPKFWKSWVMQRLPYYTDYFGCTFTRVRL